MLRLERDLDGTLDLPVLQPPSTDEYLAPGEDLFEHMPVKEDIVQLSREDWEELLENSKPLHYEYL